MPLASTERALVERNPDLATISAQWERARGQAGSIVVIGGESGVGKTALARRFVDGLGEETLVLWGGCDPLTTPRPIGPLHDVAPDLGSHVQELLSTGGYAWEIFSAVFEELAARPCVLVLDDLHWADEGTLDLLRFLIRRISSTRSLVIGIFRDDEIGSGHPLRALLGDVARTPEAVHISLSPLSVEAVGSLIGDRGIDAGHLHGITGGNPFFVTEVLDWGGEDLPGTVRDAVLARTVDLDDAARDFLDLLACAPEAIPDRLLVKLDIGIETLRVVDETGLIERSRRGVSFRHEMSRLAIADAVPPGGDVSLHLRLLVALESLGEPDPAVMANHAAKADDHGRVLRYASLAAAAASRAGAHTQAAEFLESALHHAPDESLSDRAELFDRLAVELYLTDRLPEAIVASEKEIDLREEIQDQDGIGAGHCALSTYQWYNANRAIAERHASSAVEVLEAGGDRVGLGHAYAMEAYLALHSGDWNRLESFQDRAHRVASHVDQGKLRDRLEIIDSAAAIMTGDLAARDRILSVIDCNSEHFDEIYSAGYSNLANLDVEQRRLQQAGSVLDTSLPLTVERDIPICRGWQLGVRGRLALLEGDWDSAMSDACEVLDGPAAPLARTWPHLVRGLVSLRRGTENADADLDQAWELARRYSEPLRLLPAATALAERAWLHDLDEARLDEASDLLHQYGSTPGAEWSAGELAVWLARLGRPADVEGLRLAEPYRLHLASEPSRAADAWADLSVPYDQALALVDCGRVDDATKALELLDRLGADAVASKIRQDLRAQGVTGIPARQRTATRSNPAGLTARQLEVLKLLDEGLTNAQLAESLFISPKTVDHHVSAILTKLQVSSRVEAAAEARRLGLVG